MKRLLCLFIFTLCANLQAQNPEVLSWINNNAITIEDANPDTSLSIFSKNVPPNFKTARVFGFGEADHRTKEFFNLKAKFFKYLVENQGVKVFIMEESYQAERGITEWISGGKGDKATIKDNFRMSIWCNEEIANLLEWMRDYNIGKPHEQQIRFYGMDNQFGDDLSNRLRTYVKKHNIAIDESLLAIADSCSLAKYGSVPKDWDKTVVPKLIEINKLLNQNKERLTALNASEYNDIMRLMWHLEQYTVYLARHVAGTRDNDMYNNVIKILELEQTESKAFVWTHNEHINKKDYQSYNVKSLGTHLKDHFNDDYYAVGFDFGVGVLKGYEIKNGQATKSVLRNLDKPYHKTFAEILITAQPDIYFIDMATAVTNPIAAKFFSTEMKQLGLGGPGFDPANKILIKRKYIETYDALIFVKTITPATYKKNN